MPEEFEELSLFEFEEEEEPTKRYSGIVTDEEVLFSISYHSGSESPCSEGFLTTRFAAEIAMEEAKSLEDESWVNIVETRQDGEPDVLIGSFKICSDLITMKIVSRKRLQQQVEELALENHDD